VIASSAKVHAVGLSLPKLVPGLEALEQSAGRLGGNLSLSGSGNSLARMLASSDGNVSAQMGGGRISNLLMEKAGIDIQETIKFLISKDRTIPVRCAFGDFAVKDGVMDSRALAFDTTDTVILGDGRISLRDESYDLRLKPLPKDHSFLSLRAPLMLTGSFKNPELHPDVGRITLRAAAAALLAAISPPAALIATFETGPGKDVSCRPGENFAEAQKKWTRSASN
jgi:AsmA family protein